MVSFITSLVFYSRDGGDRVPGLALSVEGEGDSSEHVRTGIALVSFDPGKPSGRDSDQFGEACEAEAASLALAPDLVSPRLHNARLGKFRQARQGMTAHDLASLRNCRSATCS